MKMKVLGLAGLVILLASACSSGGVTSVSDGVPEDGASADLSLEAGPLGDLGGDALPGLDGTFDTGLDLGTDLVDALADTDAQGCKPNCDGKDCGDDGCGDSCGACSGGKTCQEGLCVCEDEDHKACCGDAVCWFDSCGGQGAQTATCPNGCAEGTCKDCTPQCEGVECGEDGCGGDCGLCSAGACDQLMWTPGKACVAGLCSGDPTPIACDDQLACTNDTCDPKTGCGYALKGGFCLIEGVCYSSGQANPDNPCEACTPATSTAQWNPANEGGSCQAQACKDLLWSAAKTCVAGNCAGGGGTMDCDDQRPCTDDSCEVANGCLHMPKAGTCLIAGQCYAEAAPNPADSCKVCKPSTGYTQWSDATDGTPCLAASCSGLSWVGPLTCLGAVCRAGGTVLDCNDGKTCTEDACDAVSGCSNALKAQSCLIGGECFAEGVQNVSNGCQGCVSATSTNAWTNLPDLTSCGLAGQVCMGALCQLPGETCQTATTIQAGTLLGQTLAGYVNNGTTGGTCSGASGPDRIYAISVPGGLRLSASILSAEAQFDPSISLVAWPAANCDANPRVCLDSDDSGITTDPNTVSWANGDTVAKTVFIFADTFTNAKPGGAFTLTTSLTPVPAGDICEGAQVLTLPAALKDQTTVGFGDDYSGGTGCGRTFSPGLDRVYAVSLPAGQRLTAIATPTGTAWDLAISVVAGPASTCSASPLVCLAGTDLAGSGKAETSWFTNTTGAAMSVFVVVDGASATASGTFDLSVSADAPPPALNPGETCQTAPALTVGQAKSGTLAGTSGNYANSETCQGQLGPDAVYSVLVPKGKRLSVTVTPTYAWDPSLALVLGPASNCDASPRVCLASKDAKSKGYAETATYDNKSGADETVFVVVDSPIATGSWLASSTFDITASVEEIPAVPFQPGDTCQLATVLTAGTLVSGTTAGLTGNYADSVSCKGAGGIDAVYLLEAPPGKRLTVKLTPTTDWDPSISLIEWPPSSCDASPRVCAASLDGSINFEPETLVYHNTSEFPDYMYIVIDTNYANETGSFTLMPEITTILEGDLCQNAPTITLPSTVTGATTAGYANDYNGGTNCADPSSSSTGPDRVFSVSVPAGKRLTAKVTPTGTSWDPTVSLVAGPASNCSASPLVCLAGANLAGKGLPETVKYTNSSGAAVVVLVVVDGATVTDSWTFDLQVSVDTPPPTLNPTEFCTTAPALTAGQEIAGTTAGMDASFGSGINCEGTAGRDGAYSISVPKGKQLSVTVTPTSTWDPSISLVKGPAANCNNNPRSCLESADDFGSRESETVTYTNASAGAETIFVIIDANKTNASGPFTLTASLL